VYFVPFTVTKLSVSLCVFVRRFNGGSYGGYNNNLNWHRVDSVSQQCWRLVGYGNSILGTVGRCPTTAAPMDRRRPTASATLVSDPTNGGISNSLLVIGNIYICARVNTLLLILQDQFGAGGTNVRKWKVCIARAWRRHAGTLTNEYIIVWRRWTTKKSEDWCSEGSMKWMCMYVCMHWIPLLRSVA
jgi:hypothetical protein